MTVTFIEGIRIPKGQLSPTSTASRTSHCPTAIRGIRGCPSAWGYSDLWRCPEVTRPSFQIELDSLKQSGKPPETNASPEKEYFGPTKTTFSMILYKPMPAIMMPRTSKTQPVRKTSATKSASPLALSGSEAK